MRIKYDLSLLFNKIKINEVIIDQHYNEKHFDISDWVILELLKTLNHRRYAVESKDGNYSYFTIEPVFHNAKPYRIIFLLEKGCSYIGVINAFRIQEKKHGISNR